MAITRILAKVFSNYDNQKSLASRLRAKRIAALLKIIDDVADKNVSVNIIDIGGTETYWRIVPQEYLDERNVKITIVNLPERIMPKDHGRFKFVQGDGCNLTAFSDESFDIAHSNSVLEHVGDWGRMVQFAKEVSRVSAKYFVQTPNYWFPIEPHCMVPFFQWFPKPVRVWIILHFQLGHRKKATTVDEAVRIVENARLLNKKMLHELFKDAHIIAERFFCLPKSFIAVKE